ncbi:MAG TPA: DNA-3-methyladenine glycosylase [Gemmatimonadaceae bacterium]|nr:DNA-3-methyladenine glycosylase [Gemmatimonadaceae bacterium]
MSREAVRHLHAVDPVLSTIIKRVGPYQTGTRTSGTHFAALTRAIVYQQLSGKAAATILGRVHGIYGGRPPSPRQVLATDDQTLRAAGLSNQKLSYLRDLAAHVDDGRLPVARLGRLSDADAITALTGVKGIGRWTAQVYLMFRLDRPDVLPEGDLGIQKAIQRAYGLRKLPSPERVLKIGAPWAPFRSVASWYLWRSLDAD